MPGHDRELRYVKSNWLRTTNTYPENFENVSSEYPRLEPERQIVLIIYYFSKTHQHLSNENHSTPGCFLFSVYPLSNSIIAIATHYKILLRNLG
jgi:hypothetical protein